MLKYLRDRLVADKLDPSLDHGLPRRLPARDAPRDRGARCARARSAAWSPPTRSSSGIDIGALDAVVCAGYPGSVAGAVAALRPRGAARQRAASRCSSPRARRSISTSRASPTYLARRAGGAGAHRSGQRRDPRPAPEVRGLRAALRGGRRASATCRPRTPTDALEFLAQHQVVHRAGASGRRCSTGRPTPTRPTTSRCAASAGTTS